VIHRAFDGAAMRPFSAACAVVGALFVACFGIADGARAYPWLINHGYAKCAACHVDPSGAGQLSQYGAALHDQAVRWHLDPAELESGEPSPLSAALFGLPQPEWLNVSGNVRAGAMVVAKGNAIREARAFPLLMASDVYATATFSPVVAHASLGYGFAGRAAGIVGPAAVATFGDGAHALMSREHWLGVRFLDDALFVRAGRIATPFGLRNNEHVSWVRQATRSDVNVGQQHGVAVAWQNDLFRSEVMAIAGNFQLRPDVYRERGYAGFFEWAIEEKLAIAASSRVTWAARDLTTTKRNALRHEHGVFARWAPTDWIALLGEADALVATLDGETSVGGVGWLQADVIPVQGIHILPALETLYVGDGTENLPAVGGWVSLAWYPLPHTELRFDTWARSYAPQAGPAPLDLAGVLQLHLYL
jgi:hypothetical protein